MVDATKADREWAANTRMRVDSGVPRPPVERESEGRALLKAADALLADMIENPPAGWRRKPGLMRQLEDAAQSPDWSGGADDQKLSARLVLAVDTYARIARCAALGLMVNRLAPVLASLSDPEDVRDALFRGLHDAEDAIEAAKVWRWADSAGR